MGSTDELGPRELGSRARFVEGMATPVSILDMDADCLCALHEALCSVCPKSGHLFVSSCRTLRSQLRRPPLIGVKAPWTGGAWILKQCFGDCDNRFTTGEISIATDAAFVDGNTESITQFTQNTLPVLSSGVALCRESVLVKGTQVLLVAPPAAAVRLNPSGALLKHDKCSLYSVHFHRFRLDFESRLFVNNNAQPHRDNNDYDRWVEVRLLCLKCMSHTELVQRDEASGATIVVGSSTRADAQRAI